MSLSSCGICWDNPCTCGHEYRHFSENKLYDQIIMLIQLLTIKNSSPLQPILDELKNRANIQGIK